MIKRMAKSIREYKKASILTPIFVSLETIMEVIIPFVMAMLIDKGIQVSNMNMILFYGIILVLCALLSLTFGYLAGRYAAIASTGFAKNLRHDMYYKIQDFSFYNIDKFSTSGVVTRLTTDVSNVGQAYQMIIRIAVRAPAMMIFSLIMAFVINAKISLIFLAVIPFLAICLFLIAKNAKPLFDKVFNTYDELNNDVAENVRGIRVVKSYVMEDFEIKKFKNTSKKIYDYFRKAERLVTLNGPVMSLSMYTCIILIAWFSANMIVGGNMTTGELTSLITYATSILSSLMMLSMIYVMCTLAIPSIRRCSEILEEIPDLDNKKNAVKEIKNGSIEFKDVDFSYVKDPNKLALKDINIKIESGQTIGIIGSTGSSKSTLVNLIPRLYDVTTGSVLVGGIDVRDYHIKSLRDSVSMVLQKNVLFSGTIKENLLWGDIKASDKEIKEACKLACADEFINKFPNKYETRIEQGGTNVSGGQKQRLCIARALLKKPKILILDDSTSACDTATDAKIRESFKKYIPKTTKIIIAQRINSVSDADKVIIIDDGRIVAFDTPDNLLKNNEIYKDIYYSQNSTIEEGGK